MATLLTIYFIIGVIAFCIALYKTYKDFILCIFIGVFWPWALMFLVVEAIAEYVISEK